MRKYTSVIITAALLASLLPAPAAVAQSCVLGAANTVAGLGTQVTLMGCEANKSYTLTMQAPAGAPYTQSIVTNEQGDAATLIPGKSATIAGQYRIQAGDATATFSVTPDKIDDASSVLSASATSVAVGGTVTVTAILRDRYENAIADRPVIALLSNRPEDRVQANAQQSDSMGRMTWLVTAATAGTMNLTAYDILSAKALSARIDVTVGGGGSRVFAAALTGNERGGTLPVDRFEILIGDETLQDALADRRKNISVRANELFTVTIVALDANDAVVEDYLETVIMTSSDGEAEFPRKGIDPSNPDEAPVAFRPVDLGARKIPLGFLFRNGGQQTINIHEQGNSGIKGSFALSVEGGGTSGGDKIIIDEPKAEAVLRPTIDAAGGRSVLVKGKAPSLINLVVDGGSEQVIDGSKEDYSFAINVPLNPNHKEVTLIVGARDSSLRSSPVHFFIDMDAPAITGASFNPESGYAGEEVVITMHSETKLSSATATVDGTAITLTESQTESGTYIGTFMAGDDEKTYTFTFLAMDSVGNASTPLQAQWSAHKRKPGKVLNVKASGKPQGVMVEWEAPEGKMSIGQYKIYIADKEDPENILYSVETKRNVNSALIKDLQLGREYAFTLTAVNTEGQESEERSDPAFAGPQGLSLRATPDDGKVFLEWTPPLNLPLAQYILKYGTAPEDYTETRTLNPALHSHEVDDLIDGVAYEFLLIPVDVTGKVREDLDAGVAATPDGDAGYHAAAGDPVPPNLIGTDGGDGEPHPGANLTPPPETSPAGLPLPVMAGLVVLALILVFFWKHYSHQRKMAHEFLAMMENRYRS
jgi:Fibronectin type III domain